MSIYQSVRSNSGQVVLITLLVLAIATTVALSLISRTTTDVAMSSQVEESARAFSAAEAGIEEALYSKISIGPTGIVGAAGVTYSVTVSNLSGAAGLYEFPKKTLQGSTETLWLVNHNADDTLSETPTYTDSSISVCWSKKSSSEIPALVATLLYKQGTTYKSAKVAIDPDSIRAVTNRFSTFSPSGGCGGSISTDYKVTIPFTSFDPTINSLTDTLIALRLRPVYYDTRFVIDSAIQLPSQGSRIESTGSTTGGTNRKIVVYQQYRSPSTIFDAALYSENSISR